MFVRIDAKAVHMFSRKRPLCTRTGAPDDEISGLKVLDVLDSSIERVEVVFLRSANG